MLNFFFMLSLTFADSAENRCGWWENSSPGNVEFIDKDGVWTVSKQGLYEAKSDWSPSGEQEFSNGTYGRYCVCIKVKANKSTKEILEIFSGQSKKLRDCYRDKSLPAHETPVKGALKEFVGQWVSTNEDCPADRKFSIQPKHISMEGEGAFTFKVVKDKPLWIEILEPAESTDKFQRLKMKTNKQIEMLGSSAVMDEPDGTKCVLSQKK